MQRLAGVIQQKKKDWWATDVKVEFDKMKAENPILPSFTGLHPRHGYGLIIRTNLVSIIQFCILVTIRNI